MPPFPSRILSHALAAAGSAVLRAGLPLFNLTIPRSGYRVRRDIAYAGELRMDVYIPDGLKELAPLLLFFYGGSWQSGSKNVYRALGQAFASAGVIVAVADYRLYPHAKYPAFVEDGARALQFLHLHAQEFGGDATRIFVSGHSAGAHIATMLACNPNFLSRTGGDPPSIRGVIGIAGPYDFLPLRDPVLIDIFGGERVTATQPIEYAGNRAPPMLLAHGTKDSTVGAGNSRRMAKRLREAGNAVELIQYEGIGHLDILLSLAHGFRGRTSLREDMLRFIGQH